MKNYGTTTIDTTSIETKQESILDIGHYLIEVDSFLSKLPVHCQRRHEDRVNDVKKLLQERLLATHLQVAIVKCHFNDDYYKEDESYSINGNTRKTVWLKFPELKPTLPLHLDVYHAYSRQDIERIYRTLDSRDSVETSGDLIGGLFRSIGYEPKSKKFKSGNIGVALRHAYKCCNSLKRIYGNDSSYSDITNKAEVVYFEKEVPVLDEIIFRIEKMETAKRRKFITGPIMVVILVLLKKYGIDNDKVHEAINALINQKVKIKEGVGGQNDGVSVIWDDLYTKFTSSDGRRWTLQSEGDGPKIFGHILYCMDSYINDVTLKTRKLDSKKGVVIDDNTAVEYFNNYFKSKIK